MTTDSSVITDASPINERIISPRPLVGQVEQLIANAQPVVQDRRQCMVQGINPDTLERYSQQEWHYRLIMIAATLDEWQTYYATRR